MKSNEWPSRELRCRELNAFYSIRNELFIEDGILFFNRRIVVPSPLREKMLKLLHRSHFGVDRVSTRLLFGIIDGL